VPRRVPVLTAWAGGPAADALAGLTEPAIVERALEALAQSLALDAGRVREQLEGWAMHDWQADPFSRGAYAYVGVGGLKAPQALARPVQGTLFFAGEATSPDEMGTVSGAIGAGLQAARKLAMSWKTP
jgi:monoamine oxidase